MSEQATIKLPAEDGPTPDADAFLKKALGKKPAEDDAAKATTENGAKINSGSAQPRPLCCVFV